jgi:hypothetical protein
MVPPLHANGDPFKSRVITYRIYFSLKSVYGYEATFPLPQHRSMIRFIIQAMPNHI